MRIHHVNCGTMCPVGGFLFYGNRDRSLRRLTCHCLLIETDRDGLVLVDTGFGMRDVRKPRPRLSPFFLTMNRPQFNEAETALRQIEARGFSAGDVRHIVLTHLDFDHAGGIEDFPGATVHLLDLERRASTVGRRTFLARQRYRPMQWDEDISWQDYAAGGESWFGFDSVRDLRGLPPEILLIPLIGHTFGHCGVAVQQGDKWILNAGDAYFYEGEMDLKNPNCTPGLRFYQKMMEVDRTARLRNQDRLRALLRDEAGKIDIFCAHDSVEYGRHVGVETAIPAATFQRTAAN